MSVSRTKSSPFSLITPLLAVAGLALLAACVTINVYFPAAAAERAAEEFVGDVLGETPKDGSLFDPLQYSLPDSQHNPMLLAAVGLLDAIVPSAQAQQQASIDINTPQINAIKSRMAERQNSSLNAWFDAGAIGFGNDGLVAILDRAKVPLNERRNLESVVADENRDRSAVYREIAVANGHPEWEKDIQQTFAKEWAAKARSGWNYQDAAGNWKQK
ncbi:MAG TPA: YdbL family protein [Xanthomonadales bacterium]|nr:YdbL family protein [Xanthomonadales bacterium]